MTMLSDIRAKYPQYHDMSDKDLADAFHAKFYSDMPQDQFYAKIGLKDAPKKPKVSELESLWRGGLQGVSFNTSDEIWARIKSLATGEPYDKILQETRDANHEAEDQNPGSYLGGGVIGGAIPALAAWALGPEAGLPADAAESARVAALMPRMLKAAKIGFPIGAAYGAGGYEGDPDEDLASSAEGRIGHGLLGGLGGAVAGAAFTPIVDAIGAGGKSIYNMMKALGAPKQFARRKVAEALARDYASKPNAPQAIQNDISGLAQASPNAIVGDVGGDATKSLLRVARNRPNAMNQDFLQGLDQRAANQWREVEDNITKHLGNPDAYDTHLRWLAQNQADAARPAYDAAMAADFHPSDDFADLFSRAPKLDKNGEAILDANGEPVLGDYHRPLIGKLVNKVQNSIRNAYGRNADQYIDQNSLRFTQRLKQELDKQIGEAESAVEQGKPAYSADKNSLNDLRSLRKQFSDAIANSGGEGPKLYMKADQEWSNQEALQNAMEAGRRAAQKPADVIANEMADLGPAEQAHYRFGLGRGLADKNRTGNETWDRVGRDWSDPQDKYYRTPTIFGDNAADMQASLDAMAKARDLRAAVKGNSSTAGQLMANQDAKQEAEQAIGAVTTAGNIASKNWPALYTQAKNALQARIEGINPRVAEEILRLAKTPASEGDAFMQQLSATRLQNPINEAQSAVNQNRFIRGITGGPIGAFAETRPPPSVTSNDQADVDYYDKYGQNDQQGGFQ